MIFPISDPLGPVIRAFLLLIVLAVPALAAQRPASDGEIRDALVRESVAQALSDCPCPYSLKRNGQMCGNDSAYNRPRGGTHLCYDHDVTGEMVREYRLQHRLPAQ
jgi:hypothetical protein